MGEKFSSSQEQQLKKSKQFKMSDEKIQELQILESNLRNLLMQKQGFQIELSEAESALREIKSSEGDVYKIAGQFLIKSKRENVIESLEKKQKMFKLRIESIEKQESSINEKMEALQKELMPSKN